MPHAKFYADPLKTVAVHKEQRTDRHTDMRTHSVYKIFYGYT